MPKTNNSPTNFISLPLELREKIYAQILVYAIPPANQLLKPLSKQKKNLIDAVNLLLVSEAVYADASAFFYKNNTFRFNNMKQMLELSKRGTITTCGYEHENALHLPDEEQYYNEHRAAPVNDVERSTLATLHLKCPQLNTLSLHEGFTRDCLCHRSWSPLLFHILNQRGGKLQFWRYRRDEFAGPELDHPDRKRYAYTFHGKPGQKITIGNVRRFLKRAMEMVDWHINVGDCVM
ncbi:hypothetical protein EJ08DRAFT_320269 [Tothia fuscella]|uniref:F-box domain-containing protein n=1 Tax=Tothia fuscella TaxID=1048955 RepID=A0A9P4NNL4_9PEZI|nr:hypothetical protein EJ08DRAFT_320269 [Tothia fuscella]